MANRFRRETGRIVAWLVFPLVPVILADFYYQTCNFIGADPREWGWFSWVLMLGPLVGYGFLAGATVDLPDDVDQPRRDLRRLASRRAVWVTIGPWAGFLIWIGVYFGYSFAADRAPVLWRVGLPTSIQGTWFETLVAWALGTFVVVTLSYAWLWPARAALRRAARIGRLRRTCYQGLSIALAFVGSLFGSFWAATSWWRSFFFDPRLMPLIFVAVALAATSGCGDTITYGEVRRRELFHAMLVAWVLGLALMWRWWSRRRPRPPEDGASS